MNIQQIEDTIGFLNSDIYESTGLDYGLGRITMESDGSTIVIKFLGVVVWDSEDDMREEYDDDVIESLYSYLQREVLAIISRLQDIDF